MAYPSTVLGQEGGGVSALEAFVNVVLALVFLFLYFLPSLFAWKRQVPNAVSVYVVNFFFGWSLIGWMIALWMVFRDSPGPLASGQASRPSGPPNEPPAPSP
jgi:hypothetical protein